ncbi:MAG: alkaline phosphatase, partial [Pseudomonadota bacterium]
ETRRYAAMLGATAEFNAITGIAVNAADRRLYLAVSDIDGGMLPSTVDPADHIQVQRISAGVVYELNLESAQKDSRRRDIESEYVATSVRPITLLVGEDLPTADDVGNTSNIDRIANPDTLKFSENLRTLFIAENGRRHINNFLWTWQVDISELSRVMSVPAGAGVSGLQVATNINGFNYLMANYQHPGLYATAMPADVQTRLNGLINKRQGAIGYFQLPGL